MYITMLTYLSTYNILICREHQRAIYGVDEHFKRYHKLPLEDRKVLLNAYSSLSLLSPDQVPLPAPYGPPLPELGAPEDALICCDIGCRFISTSRKWMQQHVNQQHKIKLTRWSTTLATSYAKHVTQLWKPVKVQTFFRETKYQRYFIVQEQQQEQQHRRQETAEQNQAVSYQQRLAYLSCECDTIERKNREDIERIAEEADAKDRTGWFKRTQWDEHLQAYPDWQLLSYVIRLPTAEEPQLQRVVQLVEGLVEEAVQGLSTLPRDTLRWLRSAKL